MEVMISFSKRDDSCQDMVSRRVTVIKRLFTEPMSQGVDTKGRLLHEEDAKNAGINEAALPVTPAKTSQKHGKDEAHEDDNLEVVTMLPHDDRVIVQIGNVGTTDPLWVLFHDHPAKVRVQETLADRVRVLVGVGVAMVSTVVSRPPADRSLDGTSAKRSQEDLEWESGSVGRMCPESMIASRDAEAGTKVVNDTEEGRFEP